jgi:hypothetical protein
MCKHTRLDQSGEANKITGLRKGVAVGHQSVYAVC